MASYIGDFFPASKYRSLLTSACFRLPLFCLHFLPRRLACFNDTFQQRLLKLIFSANLLSPLWRCIFGCLLGMSCWQTKSNLSKQIKQLLPCVRTPISMIVTDVHNLRVCLGCSLTPSRTLSFLTCFLEVVMPSLPHLEDRLKQGLWEHISSCKRVQRKGVIIVLSSSAFCGSLQSLCHLVLPFPSPLYLSPIRLSQFLI